MHLLDERNRTVFVPYPGPARAAEGRARRRRRLRVRLTDEQLIVLLAAALSIGSFVWYQRHGLTTAFNDARSRELIARRVLMSRTPGLAQLGTTWLPLPSLLMLLTIWNGALFRDGLAGALPSMLAYVIASVYVYRTARLVTSSRPAGWVAAGVLMLNPSLLYMQSTPMSETASLAAFTVAIYYGLRVARTFHAADIVKCAAAVAAGTLIRYEGWVLAIALLPLLAYVAWSRKHSRALTESWAILYGLLAFAGCAAWILYNWVIFHDPLLPFFYGQSAHTFYPGASAHELPARSHPVFAASLYGVTVVNTVGWAVVPIAVLGVVVFAWRARLRPLLLAAYLTLIPFLFYWLALFAGLNTESLPALGNGPYYNIRFGLAMIPAVALFAAMLTTVGPTTVRRTLVVVALTAVAVSAGLTLTKPFVLREALAGYGGDTRQTGQLEADWMSSHYRGGNILYTYIGDPSAMFYLLTKHDFADTDFITDANGSQFTRALARPQRWVTWMILDVENGNPEDRLWNTLRRRSDWRRYFVLRRTFSAHWLPGHGGYGTTEIYERRPRVGTTRLGEGLAGAESSSKAARERREGARLFLSLEVLRDRRRDFLAVHNCRSRPLLARPRRYAHACLEVKRKGAEVKQLIASSGPSSATASYRGERLLADSVALLTRRRRFLARHACRTRPLLARPRRYAHACLEVERKGAEITRLIAFSDAASATASRSGDHPLAEFEARRYLRRPFLAARD